MSTDDSGSGAVEITEFQVKTLLDLGQNITQIAEFFGTTKWSIMRWFPQLIREADLPEGRPATPIDAAEVAEMAGLGFTTDDIGRRFGVSRDTIERRFMDELRAGRLNMQISIKRKQVEKALAGDNTMLIWTGKQFCGQRERIEHTGLDGAPMAVQVGNADLSKLTDEQLKALEVALEATAVAAPLALPAPSPQEESPQEGPL